MSNILDETKLDINGLNLYMYCNDNPVMFVDPSGYSVIAVGIIVGGIFGLVSSLISDYDDNGSIDLSIGLCSYFGSIVGGVISGLGTGVVSTMLLGMVGSMADSLISSGFNPDFESMILDAFSSLVFAGIGYGVGQTIRYAFSGVEVVLLRKLANFSDDIMKKLIINF